MDLLTLCLDVFTNLVCMCVRVRNMTLELTQMTWWYISNVSTFFDCSMLIYNHSRIILGYLFTNLYYFWELTYWPTVECHLLFSACFSHFRFSIPNEVQLPWNFLMIFMEQIRPMGIIRRLVAWSRAHKPTRRGLGAPWWLVPSSSPSRLYSLAYKFSSTLKTSEGVPKHFLRHRKSLFWREAISSSVPVPCRRGIDHGGPLHQPWCAHDDVWVVQHRPTCP